MQNPASLACYFDSLVKFLLVLWYIIMDTTLFNSVCDQIPAVKINAMLQSSKKEKRNYTFSTDNSRQSFTMFKWANKKIINRTYNRTDRLFHYQCTVRVNKDQWSDEMTKKGLCVYPTSDFKIRLWNRNWYRWRWRSNWQHTVNFLIWLFCFCFCQNAKGFLSLSQTGTHWNAI